MSGRAEAAHPARTISAREPGAIDAAGEALSRGLVVCVPTDTVYGVAVDPRRHRALERLLAAKRRTADLAIAVLVDGMDQAHAVGRFRETGLRLALRFWPGALTIVVGAQPAWEGLVGGDGRSCGVRWPAHHVPCELSARFGPLAVTSANLHGSPPAVSALEAAEVFGPAIALVLDDGACDGTPSTVVDCREEHPRLLREGAVPWRIVAAAAGHV